MTLFFQLIFKFDMMRAKIGTTNSQYIAIDYNGILNTIHKKLMCFSHYELTKGILNIALTGELWDVLHEFF